MSDDLLITAADVEALARKLDGLDAIDDRDRAILTGVFVLAGRAAIDELADVSGFMPTAVERLQFDLAGISGLPGYLQGTQSHGGGGGSGLPGGFSWGMHGAGGGGGAGKVAAL